MTREQFRPADHPHEHFLLKTVVGSYPRPTWLDEVQETADEAAYSEAVDDACRAVISTQEAAGLDVVTDGEVRREDMVEYFAAVIDGYDVEGGDDGSSWTSHMPSVVDTVSRADPWLADDYRFAAKHAYRPIKLTITGPFTLASFSDMQAYESVPTLAGDLAALVAAEVESLLGTGVRYIQIDEPALGMTPHADVARDCLDPIAAAVPDDVRLGLHVCSGNYTNLAPDMFEFPVDELDLEFASDDADPVGEIFADVDLDVDVGIGVVDSSKKAIESVETVQANIEAALEYIPPDRLTVTPDCGMKPLPRASADGKLDAMVEAARRTEARLDDGELDTA